MKISSYCLVENTLEGCFAFFQQAVKVALHSSNKLCVWSSHKRIYFTKNAMEVKLLVRDIYMILKELHKCGYSLGGKFTAINFLLIDGLYGRKVVIGKLEEGSLW